MWKLVATVVIFGAACGDDGAKMPADAPRGDARDIDAAPACTAPTGAGTMHSGSVSAPETWTAAASPHIVPFDTSITAALTIEACAVVRIADGKGISVRQNGSLTAAGDVNRPVRFERVPGAVSPWTSISAANGGTLSFTHVEIEGGGNPINSVIQLAGMIDVAGSAPATSDVIFVDDVKLTGSQSQGMKIHDGGGFKAGSKDLVITGSTISPMFIWPRAVGTIPTGTYTGNTIDEIMLDGTGGNSAIAESTTMHERGVPYVVGFADNGVLDIGAQTGVTTLTIEPGVTIKFNTAGTFRIDAASGVTPARAALIANGTAAAPITFTSNAGSPAAGDWLGLWFGLAPDATTKLDHVLVEYSGRTPSGTGTDSCVPTGQSGPNDAAIRILGGVPQAGTSFITNSTIKDSARHGIDRGFRSDADINFVASNIFQGVPGCFETKNKSANGACPNTVTCP